MAPVAVLQPLSPCCNLPFSRGGRVLLRLHLPRCREVCATGSAAPGALASACAGPRFRLLGFLLACFPPCHLPALGDPKKQPPRATAGTVTSPVLTGGKAKTFLPPPSPSLWLHCAPTTSCVAWAEQLEQLGFAVCDLFSRRRKELGGSVVSSPGGCAFPWWGRALSPAPPPVLPWCPWSRAGHQRRPSHANVLAD